MEPSSRRMLLQFWIIQFLRSFGKFLHRSEISSIICKKRMFPNQVNQITSWLPSLLSNYQVTTAKLPTGYQLDQQKSQRCAVVRIPPLGPSNGAPLHTVKLLVWGGNAIPPSQRWLLPENKTKVAPRDIKGMPNGGNGVAGFEKYARFVDLLNIKTAQSATVSSIQPRYLIWNARLRRRWLSASSCGRRRRGWSAHGGTFSVIQAVMDSQTQPIAKRLWSWWVDLSAHLLFRKQRRRASHPHLQCMFRCSQFSLSADFRNWITVELSHSGGERFLRMSYVYYIWSHNHSFWWCRNMSFLHRIIKV